MNKFFLISAFLSWASMAQAEGITLTPSGGGTGGITNGSTPIIGATSGQYLYNNSGVVGFQTLSGGGNVSSSGTPAANNLGLWSSSTAIGPLIPGTNILTGLATNLNGTGAITGTTNPVFVTPALGTPSSGTLTNTTGFPASALASGALPGGATINDGNWFGTVLSVAHGGTGTASPGLIAGTNITSITGTWPNQTINASGGGGAVSSVSNSDSTLTVTPTTGAVVASLNLGHANTWTSTQTFPSPAFTGTVTGAGTIPVGVISATGTPSSANFLRGDGTWNAVSGGITGPGTTVSGDIATWNSTTGAAIADSGISLSSQAAGLFLATPSGSAGVPSFRALAAADLGSYTLTPLFLGVGLKGSSSGNDTISSLNSSTSSRTITIPAGTANDTLAMLGASQTFSGANIHSGSELFTGAPTTFTGNNQTTIQGGTTAPSFGSYTGAIAIGGNYSGATLSAGGQGAILMNGTAYGLTIQGNGTSYDSCLANYTGSCVITVKHGSTGTIITGAIYYVSNHLYSSNTAPTFSGATAGTSNGTLAFTFVPTASGASVTITLPAASTGWVCQFTDLTTPTQQVRQTGVLSATSVTASAFTWAGATGAFGTSDTVTAMCAGI